MSPAAQGGPAIIALKPWSRLFAASDLRILPTAVPSSFDDRWLTYDQEAGQKISYHREIMGVARQASAEVAVAQRCGASFALLLSVAAFGF